MFNLKEEDRRVGNKWNGVRMDKRDIEAGKHTAVAGYSKYSDE